MPTHKHNPELLARLGERVQQARLARGLTQAELAEAVGIEPVTLSRYETGARGASVTTLHLISHALGLSLAQLLDEDEVPEPSHSMEVMRAIRVLENLDAERLGLAIRVIEAFEKP